MYLFIPLLLILLSAVFIFLVIWRKAPYIKKLSASTGFSDVEAVPSSNFEFLSKLFQQSFPELTEAIGEIKFGEYKDAWLVEVEKFLRRLRLLSLRIDRLSNTLIYKIRKGYESNEQSVIQDVETKSVEVIPTPVIKTQENNAETWKREEQRLIIEIAKNPKDSKLYGLLGELYVKMGDYSDAKESFEAAIELDPANEELKKKHSVVTEKVIAQE